MNNFKSYFPSLMLLVTLYLSIGQNSFAQNLILDGNFTGLSNASGGELGYNETLNNWSSSGYNFVFPSGNAGDVAITSSYGAFSLWGPNTGSANGLTLPPGGGNVVANDGAFTVGPLSQVVNLLTPGHVYAVSFQWAGAQQSSYNGNTTDSWSVALGGAGFTQNSDDTGGTLAGSQTTVTLNNLSHGFTGWMNQTFDFTATSTSETLYFLANGTPTGEPPFALLANVSVVAVPELKSSSCWLILFVLLIMGGNWMRRCRQEKSSPEV